jgi:hypothetical protein
VSTSMESEGGGISCVVCRVSCVVVVCRVSCIVLASSHSLGRPVGARVESFDYTATSADTTGGPGDLLRSPPPVP